MKFLFLYIFLFAAVSANAQNSLASKVNVFLGSSGDHGQLSPAASYPFSMIDVGPQTYPTTHTGYEYKAKICTGFTHGRLEGVGCMGSGGNLLIKPFTGMNPNSCILTKKAETGTAGYYSVNFENGIDASFSVKDRTATERYRFPKGAHGLYIDMSHALANGFKNEQHTISIRTDKNTTEISGWIESGTTCRMGTYHIYYDLLADKGLHITDSTAHSYTLNTDNDNDTIITMRVAFSSVSTDYAKAAVNALRSQSFDEVKTAAVKKWESELNTIQINDYGGHTKEENLFYSLLYRVLQAPFDITESDGTYRGNDGQVHSIQGNGTAYSGWSVWDNYKTALPLLSIMEPERYRDIINSLAHLYEYGKHNWATQTEPSNTVRTEHSIVVLLDAYRKGYPVDFGRIKDSLLKEADHLDFSTPDKALESSYDTWAMAQILYILKDDSLGNSYLQKAVQWKDYWNKDFKDLTKPDIDRMGARNMYQGTILQYRWFVPFDQKGLINACGGEQNYLHQLDEFFQGDYYSATNEPDIQAPYMYQFTDEPWKSQYIIRKYAQDTVIQYYYDENNRGNNPTIDRIYNNRPDAFVLSMDDDMGAMSAWYIFAAIGLSPACVGEPVYYLHVPIFSDITIGKLHIQTVNENKSGECRYIQSAVLNGKSLVRNWITQQEIVHGGTLVITASDTPNKNFGINNRFVTDMH